MTDAFFAEVHERLASYACDGGVVGADDGAAELRRGGTRELFLLVAAYNDAAAVSEDKTRKAHRQRLRKQSERLRLEIDEAAEDNHVAAGRRYDERRVTIGECRASWTVHAAEHQRSAHAHAPRQSTKAFYMQVATKICDNTVYAVGAVSFTNIPRLSA